MQRKWLFALVLGGLQSSLASAGLWETVFRGIDLAATPIGNVSLSGDGFQTNGQRNGRARIVPNDLGDGYRLEFDRNFGLDSAGRPEVFDAGPVEMELAGRVQATGQYTTRGFLIGSGDLSIQNLNYAFRGKTGAQDVEYTGTMNLVGNVEINQFGFYTYNLTASNSNSQLKVDGIVAQDEKTTDFDIGPIAVKGNIFIDGLTSLLASTGIEVPDLGPLNNLSPAEQIGAAIQDQIAKVGVVAGDQATNDLDAAIAQLNGEVISAALTGNTPDGEAVNGLLAIAAQSADFSSGDGGTTDVGRVPEPATLVLLTLVGATVMRRR